MSNSSGDDTRSTIPLPSAERIQQELGTARSTDDFFGKDGIFACLFATTLEHMLDAELTAHLGYNRYAVHGRNSGNRCTGKRTRTPRTSHGETPIRVPRVVRSRAIASPQCFVARSGVPSGVLSAIGPGCR